jgi:hypothetical protein
MMRKERPMGSLWDRTPTPMRWVIGISAAIYFGGGLIAPFFWRF